MADLTFTPDPDDPGGHRYVMGDPVPQPLRQKIKHLGGVYRKNHNPPAWHMTSVLARELWRAAQEDGYELEHRDAVLVPERRRLMDCGNDDCRGPRWTDETGRCGHCGSDEPMRRCGWGYEEIDPTPSGCPDCGQAAPPDRRHCSRDATHPRGGLFCSDCGAPVCKPGRSPAGPAAPCIPAT